MVLQPWQSGHPNITADTLLSVDLAYEHCIGAGLNQEAAHANPRL